ncbi:MAG: rod shape-determining protein MreC [Bacteroidetes bacterium]|nr:rod shape-determining protein MreC [Bacteroidota bacterium]
MLSVNTPVLRSLRALTLDWTSSVEARFAWVGTFFRALNENQELRRENIALASEVARSREARLENAQLRSMLRFEQRSSFPLLPARIVARDLFGQQNHVTLNVGRRDSVEVGMAVVTERGILGKVILVGDAYSSVMPLLNTDFRVPAKVQPLQTSGILRWPGTDPTQLLLEHIVKTEPVEVGQLVVTSGESSVFPEGYPIGRVDSVAIKVGRNTLDLYVAPLVSLHVAPAAFVILQTKDPELAQFSEMPVR